MSRKKKELSLNDITIRKVKRVLSDVIKLVNQEIDNTMCREAFIGAAALTFDSYLETGRYIYDYIVNNEPLDINIIFNVQKVIRMKYSIPEIRCKLARINDGCKIVYRLSSKDYTTLEICRMKLIDVIEELQKYYESLLEGRDIFYEMYSSSKNT